MSASNNPDAMTPAQGGFRNKVAPSQPLTTKGHKPGVLVGNDAAPQFQAEAHEPGTAPPSRTFRPNPMGEVPSQALNPDMESGTAASDTLPGATSADVNKGYGHPGGGMTSQELHGGRRKKERAGLEGVGASAGDPIHGHGFDREHEMEWRGKSNDTENWPGAEERVAAGAEEVASERR